MKNTFVIENVEHHVLELNLEYRNGYMSFTYSSYDLLSVSFDDAREYAEGLVIDCFETEGFVNNPTKSFNDLVDSMSIEELYGDIEDVEYVTDGYIMWQLNGCGQGKEYMPTDIQELWSTYHMENVYAFTAEHIVDRVAEIVEDLGVNQEWGF